MDRRDFLKAGTAAGLAGLSGMATSSCATLSLKQSILESFEGLPDMEAHLGNVDAGLEKIGQWNLVDPVRHPDKPVEAYNDLARKSLRTLYLDGMFMDLPEAGQVHPGMQQRMWDAMPEMDEAVFGMKDFLASRTSTELVALQAELRRHDDPGMVIAQKLVDEGRTIGLPVEARLRTRMIASHVVNRMRFQPPGLVIHEYAEKIEKMTAKAGSAEEMNRRLTIHLSQEALREKERRLDALARQWQAEGEKGQQTGIAPSVPPPAQVESSPVTKLPVQMPRVITPYQGLYPIRPVATPEERKSKKERIIIAGGVTLGMGVVLTTVGVLVMLLAEPITGAFIITPGALALIAGLITLIIGLCM